MTDELEAIGWNAIDAALRPLYPDQEPKHWAAILPMMIGGTEPAATASS